MSDTTNNNNSATVQGVSATQQTTDTPTVRSSRLLGRSTVGSDEGALKFYALLNMTVPDTDEALQGTEEDPNTVSIPVSKAETTQPEKAEKKVTAAKSSVANSKLVCVAEKPHAASDVDTDQKTLDEMWTVDAQNLTPQDVNVILNLGQVPPPIQQLNNFSPSLMEQLPQTYYKSLGVSSELKDMLVKAYKAQQPVRINISDATSVILRMGRDGLVSAEFLAHDAVSDLYLRQNLQDLKDRLASKQLPFGDITYRQSSQQQDDEDQRRS